MCVERERGWVGDRKQTEGMKEAPLALDFSLSPPSLQVQALHKEKKNVRKLGAHFAALSELCGALI